MADAPQHIEWTYLRNKRLEARLTPTQLAERLGVTKNYYWQVERGYRLLHSRPDILGKLADILGVSILELDRSRPVQRRNRAPQVAS